MQDILVPDREDTADPQDTAGAGGEIDEEVVVGPQVESIVKHNLVHSVPALPVDHNARPVFQQILIRILDLHN